MGGLEDLPILLHHKVDDLVENAVIDDCGDQVCEPFRDLRETFTSLADQRGRIKFQCDF